MLKVHRIMFLVPRVYNKIPVLNLTVCRVSPMFTLPGKEAFPKGSNVLNTQTLTVPFILASVILLKWTVTLNKLHSLLFPMMYKFTNLPHE